MSAGSVQLRLDITAIHNGIARFGAGSQAEYSAVLEMWLPVNYAATNANVQDSVALGSRRRPEAPVSIASRGLSHRPGRWPIRISQGKMSESSGRQPELVRDRYKSESRAAS